MVYGQLHQFIEQCKWDELARILRSHHSTTANDIALLHPYANDAREIHHEDLPLHMACERRAPPELIRRILNLYPDATKHKGRGGNLPIHIAVHRNLNEEVIDALIRANPETLDEKNQANFTPRNIGHSELETNQALNRPTACWHQLIDDEVREEEQVTRLTKLHEEVDAALEKLLECDNDRNGFMGRLEQVEARLVVLEGLKYEANMTKTIQKLQESVREQMETTENRLTTVEDDIKAAAAREFMAKAASRAHQSDVVRMQKKTGETAKQILQQVDQVRSELMSKANLCTNSTNE
jgi:hypothetical protein